MVSLAHQKKSGQGNQRQSLSHVLQKRPPSPEKASSASREPHPRKFAQSYHRSLSNNPRAATYSPASSDPPSRRLSPSTPPNAPGSSRCVVVTEWHLALLILLASSSARCPERDQSVVLHRALLIPRQAHHWPRDRRCSPVPLSFLSRQRSSHIFCSKFQNVFNPFRIRVSVAAEFSRFSHQRHNKKNVYGPKVLSLLGDRRTPF